MFACLVGSLSQEITWSSPIMHQLALKISNCHVSMQHVSLRHISNLSRSMSPMGKGTIPRARHGLSRRLWRLLCKAMRRRNGSRTPPSGAICCRPLLSSRIQGQRQRRHLGQRHKHHHRCHLRHPALMYPECLPLLGGHATSRSSALSHSARLPARPPIRPLCVTLQLRRQHSSRNLSHCSSPGGRRKSSGGSKKTPPCNLPPILSQLLQPAYHPAMWAMTVPASPVTMLPRCHTPDRSLRRQRVPTGQLVLSSETARAMAPPRTSSPLHLLPEPIQGTIPTPPSSAPSPWWVTLCVYTRLCTAHISPVYRRMLLHGWRRTMSTAAAGSNDACQDRLMW